MGLPIATLVASAAVTGATGATTQSRGIQSVTRDGVGDYTVTLSRAYATNAVSIDAVVNELTARVVVVNQTTTTVIKVNTFAVDAIAQDVDFQLKVWAIEDPPST